MNTKTLSPRALATIDQYLHFRAGPAMSSVPYFNNKTVRARATLAVYVGKGSPREIFDEVQALAIQNHARVADMSNDQLKKLLTDNDVGIDCSGFSYHVLNAESEERGMGSLEKHVSFIHSHGLFGKFMSKLNPAKNIDVETLANDKNSRAVPLKEVEPGDIITMIGDVEEGERNHILIIHQIEYQNFVPIKIHYSHAVAYPEDGIYGTGIKQGTIEVIAPDKRLIDQVWSENGTQGPENRIFIRAEKSLTDLRRLRWF